MTLLSAPLELGCEWGGLPSNDPFAVISRMREVCLSGVRLQSDRQPAKLRVDDHTYLLVTAERRFWRCVQTGDVAAPLWDRAAKAADRSGSRR